MNRDIERLPFSAHVGGPTGATEERPVLVEARGPSHDALRAAYDTAIRDIEAARGTHQFENGFHRQIADAVFEGCFSALEHSAEWLEERGQPAKASHKELREVRLGIGRNTVAPRLNVVSAPMGTGKTTFTTAFIVAMVRLSDENSDSPYGCLFLTDQIVKAEAMYRELAALLPGKVAVWTSDHDPDCKEPTRVLQPAARFSKDELEQYPVAVVTHAFFKGEGADTARVVRRGRATAYRALTVVDEQMQDVVVHDTSLVAVSRVIELLHEHQRTELLPHLDTLLTFMGGKAVHGARIEKPNDDKAAWKIAVDLEWFTTQEADWFVTDYRERMPEVVAVFGFAKAMVRDYAFIASGVTGPRFVGFEPQHSIVPGMVLLDATADLDGVTPLCPWRSPVAVPRGRYDNLHIIHVDTCHTDTLPRFLATLENRRTYVDWMAQVIRNNLGEGQCGLVVCKKSLLDTRNVPDWPEDDHRFKVPSAYMASFGWELDGRRLSITYWGGAGVGSNVWRDADTVFLFDEYFLPRRAIIGVTQGLLLDPTASGPLAKMTALNTSADEVTSVEEGHLNRWTKQLAMRGRARHFDEHGVCGHQKLVVTGDFERFLLHKDVMFPGAKLVVAHGLGNDPSEYSHRRHLLEFLSNPALPQEVPTKRLVEHMGVEAWGDISGALIDDDTLIMLRSLGWAYLSRRGPAGSLFQRIQAE